MLNVVLNESEIIKRILEGECNQDNIIMTLNLLIKHYYLADIKNELELRERVLEYLKINYINYKRAKWEDIVSKMIHGFLGITKRNKIDVKMIDIPRVGITKSELETIKKLDDIKLEKIAFIMLIYAKISNITRDNLEGWINKSCSIICKEAKVNLKGIEKDRIFNDLYVKKYIEQRKNNSKTNMKICYIDNISQLEIIIDDFTNVIYYYVLWENKDMIRCMNCGKPIKVTSNNRKYCPKCWKEIEREQTKERVRRFRENQKCNGLENSL